MGYVRLILLECPLYKTENKNKLLNKKSKACSFKNQTDGKWYLVYSKAALELNTYNNEFAEYTFPSHTHR